MTDTEPKALITFGNEDRQLIHAMIGQRAGTAITPQEFDYFLRVCALRGLNPLFREAHLIKDRDGRINVQVGIDGFRKLSEESGEYAGQTEPIYEGTYEGPIKEWQGKPARCRVGVYRKGWAEPVWGDAWLEEDGGLTADWQNGQKVGEKPSGVWGTRPRTMLAKVAEARARRIAFPRAVAGLYTDDELPGEPGNSPAAVVSTIPAPTGATETAETAETVVEGTWRPPEPPAGISGPVKQAPDGLREVKSSAHPPKWEGTKPKAEVVITVGRSKHTAILLDGLARAAIDANLQEGEQVVFVGGHVEEIEWAEGKPKKKEVWGTTALHVNRNGEWLELTDPQTTLDADASDDTRDEPPAIVPAQPAPVESGSAAAEASATPEFYTRIDNEDFLGQVKISGWELGHRGEGDERREYAVLRAGILSGEGEGQLIRAVFVDDELDEVRNDEGGWRIPDGIVGLTGTWKSGWVRNASVARSSVPVVEDAGVAADEPPL